MKNLESRNHENSTGKSSNYSVDVQTLGFTVLNMMT